MAGPTDQKRLGHESQREKLPLSNPPDAPNEMVGKKAAFATPIWAFAAATRRSAAAISGLRSRISDGMPTGIVGGTRARGVVGMERLEVGFPISSAMACSNCARCTPTSIAWAWVVLSW